MVNDSENTAPAGTSAGTATAGSGYAPEHEAPSEVDTQSVLATSILTPADQLAAKLARSRYEWRITALALAGVMARLIGLPPDVDEQLLIDACEKARAEGEAQGDDRSMQATLNDALKLDIEIEALEAAQTQSAPAEAQQAA